MTVYVDESQWKFRRMVCCHMMADSLDELHEMASAIGMKREWFQDGRYPHYDVSKSRRAVAVELGAVEVSSRDLIRMFKP
jgi:hypothetical protein